MLQIIVESSNNGKPDKTVKELIKTPFPVVFWRNMRKYKCVNTVEASLLYKKKNKKPNTAK